MRCDVLVLGGGAAGLAAAVASARQGAHTILLERHGMLGGMATTALVHSICGLYLLRDEPDAVLAHTGFPTEFARQLIQAGAASGPIRMGRVDVLLHSPPGFAVLADAVTLKHPNLEVRLHAEAIAAEGDQKIRTFTWSSLGRRVKIEPTVVVEASGDAVLAELLPIPSEMAQPGQLQRPAFIFSLHGADPARLDGEGRLQLAHHIAKAVRAGVLPEGALGAHFRLGHRGTEVFVTIDLAGEPEYDPTKPRQLGALEQGGRRLAAELTRYLRTSHPAFAQAAVAAFPTRLGVRESRRLQGRITITQEEVLSGSPHADAVAIGAWPIELREKHTGPRWRFPEGNRPTQIPLGALRARTVDNLWVAGRCLSCDHEAQAALRVIGTCLATGQAAGMAAALQAAHGTCPSAEEVRTCVASL